MSVASDFDATITSDIGMESKYPEYNKAYYGYEDFQSEDVQPHATRSSLSQSSFQHVLQHKQSQSPMIDPNAEPELLRQPHTPGISGRFDAQQNQFGNLAVRSFEDPASAQVEKGSRKRSRSGERYQPSTIFEERSSQLDTFEDDDVHSQEAGILPERHDNEDYVQTPSNSPRKNHYAQNPPGSQTSNRAGKTPATVENPVLPEYTDAALQKMAYADLEKEPWETVDSKKGFQLAKPLRDTNSLQEKLEHYTFKEEQDAQVAFFDQLSFEQWEEGGDWFVDRFAELIKEIKNKRMEKKKIAQKYEEEISAREKLVRGKSDHLDREFRDMRVGGEGILRGKKV